MSNSCGGRDTSAPALSAEEEVDARGSTANARAALVWPGCAAPTLKVTGGSRPAPGDTAPAVHPDIEPLGATISLVLRVGDRGRHLRAVGVRMRRRRGDRSASPPCD
ncbi:hypothetical protein STRTUCAR8_00172 [Streptomyces turgidiscabies Car8]|uniref:Uncharacterized protein n=1 Tax=Streptomyces turgidiscabies (strain Car8) TaxID=698760 RepID=L7F266_STRT8|nr:hypothetical protein STRTUCAR8_00172 [Streptomyces turgidiscabies Car8]